MYNYVYIFEEYPWLNVIPVAQARAGLSAMLSAFRHDEAAEPVVIGAHRRPEAVLMTFERYRRLADRGHGVTLDQCVRWRRSFAGSPMPRI